MPPTFFFFLRSPTFIYPTLLDCVIWRVEKRHIHVVGVELNTIPSTRKAVYSCCKYMYAAHLQGGCFNDESRPEEQGDSLAYYNT